MLTITHVKTLRKDGFCYGNYNENNHNAMSLNQTFTPMNRFALLVMYAHQKIASMDDRNMHRGKKEFRRGYNRKLLT